MGLGRDCPGLIQRQRAQAVMLLRRPQRLGDLLLA